MIDSCDESGDSDYRDRSLGPYVRLLAQSLPTRHEGPNK